MVRINIFEAGEKDGALAGKKKKEDGKVSTKPN